MKSLGVLVLVLICHRNIEGFSRVDPLVDTKVGLIRGLRSSDYGYSMFLGIPYGKVNETNPFGAASTHPNFDDVFEAYDDSSVCPQMAEHLPQVLIGTLDCLHLNIFVPNTAHSRNRLPVLVWIHGGGFSFGDSNRRSSNPTFLLKHDIIFVSINYRLGPYGFMCLGIPEVPGNQGLKDQVMALRWINENIEAFGGDVNRITIFGESAGAMSVDTHLYSETEKLFNSVIMNSGTAFIPEIGSDPDYEAPLKLADILGLNTRDVFLALIFLTNTDPLLVIAAASKLERFFPCVEGEFQNVERFLADYPRNINPLKTKDMSMLIEVNNNECMLCMDVPGPDYYNNYNGFYEYLKFAFNFEEENLLKMVDLMKHYYIGDDGVSENQRKKIADFESDYKFVFPVTRSIKKYVQNAANKVFYYMFSYDGGRNFNKEMLDFTFDGAAHADDLGYLFDILQNRPIEDSAKDLLMVDRMTIMWTNFVKYGPNSGDIGNPAGEMEAYYKRRPFILRHAHIDTEMKMGTRPYHDRTAFWELFYDFNEKFQKGYKEENEM